MAHLSHYYLLYFDVFAVHEADHIYAGGGVEGSAASAVDGLAAEEATREVDDLQGGLAVVVDDELAVAEEGEAVAFGLVAVGAKHQAEAALKVCRLGFEAVARGGQQVDVGIGHIINKV